MLIVSSFKKSSSSENPLSYTDLINKVVIDNETKNSTKALGVIESNKQKS